MSLYKRADVWWYKFKWNGEVIRESTRTGNQRAAEQIEAARKTQLAKAEVGIKDRTPCPTLGEFAERSFLPFVENSSKNKPKTVGFYRDRARCLKTFPRLWNSKMDAIQAADINAYVGARQMLSMETSTINRDLATLRRMFRLAVEWEQVTKLLPKVRLLPGENRRERIVSPDEEAAYLEAAAPLLRDFALIAIDCGLRPEESYRLKWAQYRNGSLAILTGKTKESRRNVPASPRVAEMLDGRKADSEGDWIFPAPTKTGHIGPDSIKLQHAAALEAAGLEHFVIYSLRHTCLTRWAELPDMDIFTLKKLAGHARIETTMRYVHMTDGRARKTLEMGWEALGGHKKGQEAQSEAASAEAESQVKVRRIS